ncbi:MULTISPECIES: DNA methyltransferase [Vibrio harveyi group]|uniref:DNA methyltransferase n=1 Tax=Vibrio harveyi group TaxID=717610 RepID=UPI001375FE67|nr:MULTISPECIES: DNA methyltransferase [Vibrio harveyi group]EGR1192369.1 hypothetical protein [Vibrio parahaemolyticus]EGR1206176.1 hypothetical protein [Vibrio parahaemolyticus]EGR1207470.1 hypothetical protein [Vibrio parahaemolyticus]EGR1212500.1 hypothetical protein [Vibrio parahaemolyticus]MBM5143408.1 hypothetical protein [Vibrio parahaemolyticus]
MIANAKRTRLEKVNVHNWHPYYAGYSESFVRSVINNEITNLGQDSIILDPWVGSGTTGIVCQKLGFNCIGIDVNKAMAVFSSAKSSSLISQKSTLDESLSRIIDRAKKTRKKVDVSHLHEIMSEELATKVIKLLLAIKEEFRHENVSTVELNPIESFFKAVLLVTNRKVMGYKKGSNPTWFHKTEPNQRVSFKTLATCFQKNYEQMVNDLAVVYNDVDSREFNVFEASSTSLPVPDSSVDLIVTSPPYLTRIDYAVSTQVELLLLSGKEGYRGVRENTIGTTTIHSQERLGKEEWGQLCNNVIDSINNHHSYASQSYYIKNKVQYFDSTYRSLKELYRVMKTNTSAYLVIQNSYYKEIPIDLPRIYREMAMNIGFSSSESMRKDDLRITMASINSKSKKYTDNKVYYEEIIRIKK